MRKHRNNGVCWTIFGICIILIALYIIIGEYIPVIFFGLAAIAVVPLSFIDNLFSNISIKRYVSYILAVILIGVGIYIGGVDSYEKALDTFDKIQNGQSLVDDNNKSDETTNSPYTETTADTISYSVDLDSIPEYTRYPYVVINENEPFFTSEEITTVSFENYSPLDSLGRCGVCTASIGRDLMPTESRGDISSVHPTGWVQNSYTIVESGMLYNRCHIIGFQLAGENDNKCNLITGTRYLNTVGMLEFENLVANYVKETNNHVMYRVTPIFEGDNLVCSGVLMEGLSVEDNGEGITFNVYCYNIQPGISIDYSTGENWLTSEGDTRNTINTYIVNVKTMKFHKEDCSSAMEMSEKNKQTIKCTRKEIIEKGYSPCGYCNP